VEIENDGCATVYLYIWTIGGSRNKRGKDTIKKQYRQIFVQLFLIYLRVLTQFMTKSLQSFGAQS